MNGHPSGGRNAKLLAAEILILSSFVCSAAGGADKLWGSENLLAGPKLRAGDTVTVCLTRRTVDAPKPTAASRKTGQQDRAGRSPAPTEVSARIVKVLPNGNLVLEARARHGEGSMLLGGEVARIDVGVDRKVDVGRLSNLAVVARKIDPGKLAGILRFMNGARVAADPVKTSNRKPKQSNSP